MAEFSAQWCEKHDPEGLQPDFDILQIAEGLENDSYTQIICEGYGFVAIGKDESGKIILGFCSGPVDELGKFPVEWKDYDEVVNKQSI